MNRGTAFRMNTHRLTRSAALAATLTLAMLATAAVASAAQRYAAPGGTGPAATCPQSDPCDLETAVEAPDVTDGDEVIVTPGTYSIADLYVSDAIDLHGQASQPRPTISASASSQPGIAIGAAATVRDLEVESVGYEAVRMSVAGITVERVSAHATAGGAIACSVFSSAIVRDTLCWGSGSNSRGLGANLGTFAGSYAVRLRNVTAVGTSNGIGFDYSGTGVDFAIDAKNVIADGPAFADVRAAASSGASVAVTLASSNYATEQELTNGGGVSATVTDPGSGSNQTAAPSFVDAGTGDFHQQAGSPTIDAGVLDGFTGSGDFDGDARTLEGDGVCPTAPDIGADEFTGAGPIDCDPPETSITGGPSGPTSDPTPTFDLDSDEPISTFECALDGGGFSPCGSPYTTPPLADGGHMLEVRATDQSGNTDPTPASRSFRVDTDPPQTTISGGPTGATADPTPTFNLGSDEASSSFECRIDAGAFSACGSPFTTAALADGDHQLLVRAIDPAGNTDPTPASRSFRVDTDPPQTTITDAPKRTLRTSRKRIRVTLGFSADEGARFECSLDGAPPKACSSPVTRKVGKGRHTWTVRAIDEVGNADATPAKAAFKVKRKRPRKS